MRTVCVICVYTVSLKCPRNEHKEHRKQLHSECSVAKEFQCQDHDIDHPENFNEKEDILVEKNIFYHNLKLVDQPREHSTGQIKFAGITKICKVCCLKIKCQESLQTSQGYSSSMQVLSLPVEDCFR